MQLHKYEENYGEALDGFSRAAVLDPAWPEPQQREQQLLEFLNRLTSLLESKVKVSKGRILLLYILLYISKVRLE